MAPDGLSLAGEAARLVRNDHAWEGAVVEAPTMWKHKGKYYLFYSANNYAGSDYAVGYAMADTALGPYRKASEPFLKTTTEQGPVLGPGGQDIVVAPSGETWMLYHSWDPSVSYRNLNIDKLTWEGDKPKLAPAYKVPEPAP
jgi:beta-xylosidase